MWNETPLRYSRVTLGVVLGIAMTGCAALYYDSRAPADQQDFLEECRKQAPFYMALGALAGLGYEGCRDPKLEDEEHD
jgi:hypothetical protein